MIEFETVSYVKFDGDLCKGTIGERPGKYVFTHCLKKENDFLVATYEVVKEAVKSLGEYRMYKDPAKLVIFDGFVRVPEDKVDELERELNTLVSAWHQKS